jgi:hypothetical protein
MFDLGENVWQRSRDCNLGRIVLMRAACEQNRPQARAIGSFDVPDRVIPDEYRLFRRDVEHRESAAKGRWMWLAPTHIHAEDNRVHSCEQTMPRQLQAPGTS